MDASRLARLWTLSMTTPVTGVTASGAPSTSRAGGPSLANIVDPIYTVVAKFPTQHLPR